MTDFPPAPWDLAGAGHITTWRIDAAALPVLPEGVRPWVVRGQALVVTAFVACSEEGLMAYHELYGVDRAMFQIGYGGMSQADHLAAIERLGTEVAPVVRREIDGLANAS